MGELFGILAILMVLVGLPLIMVGISIAVGLSTIVVYLAVNIVVVPIRGLYRLITRHRPQRAAP